MAAKLGVSQSFYSAIEGDRKPITPKVLAAIKQEFDVSESYFTRSKLELREVLNGVQSKTKKPLVRRVDSARRHYKDPSIARNEEWQKLHDLIIGKIKRCDFLYQRIIDGKILLSQLFKVKVIGANWGTYENHIIDSVYKDEAGGWYRANNSTIEELKILNTEIDELIEFLDNRFFYIFKTLYTGLEENLKTKFNFPATIE